MQVTKRNGNKETVSFDNITRRIQKISAEISSTIDPIRIAQKVCNSLYDNVTTTELDELSAEISISLSTIDPHYGTLAAHLCVNNLHKATSSSFSDTIERLHDNNKVTPRCATWSAPTAHASKTRSNTSETIRLTISV